MKEHWDSIYASREVCMLGWYEERPKPSLELLAKIGLKKSDPILDVGVGASTFVDCLLEQGFSNIFASDISEKALKKLKARLGEEKSENVKWIVDDVTKPRQLQNLRDMMLWHDRALLHFLLEEKQRSAYLSLLKRIVRKGGYVIIATFSLKGASKCSGLTVKNYDQDMLSDFLGEEFKLHEGFDYLYHMPSGDERSFIYTLFQRK